MTRKVVSLPEDATLGDAMDLVRRQRIHHIPILRGERVVGLVTDRDLLRALPSAILGAGADDYRAALEQITVGRIMTRDPECAEADVPLVDIVQRMLERHVDAMPVVEDGRLAGILTSTDCQTILVEMLRPKPTAPRATAQA